MSAPATLLRSSGKTWQWDPKSSAHRTPGLTHGKVQNVLLKNDHGSPWREGRIEGDTALI